MVNLGNAWHIPANPEPRGRSGMRDPVFPTTPVSSVIITSGNQFQGGGNPGNQLQDGSSLFFKRATDGEWTLVPLIFAAMVGNNKYYSAELPVDSFQPGVVVQYYLRIVYDDHDTTFLYLNTDGTTSVTTADEGAAQAAPYTFTLETPDVRGQWGPVFPLPNVGIHAHVMANGLVLMWGRRDSPDQSLDVDPPSPLHPGAPPAPPAQCTPFLWNPTTGQVMATPQPALADPAGTKANLFCSGHAFLPDGRLLVAGGHLADSAGLSQTALYDPVSNTWTPSAVMASGRWYPTATSLPDGSLLVLSGCYRGAAGNTIPNTVPEVWKDGTLPQLMDSPAGSFDLYPRLHVASNGLVYTTGSLQQTWSLNISGGGKWNKVPTQRDNAQRDYAPSVLYDVDKVIYIGGGSPPTANAELLDMTQSQPTWQQTAPMSFPRRQHNATILPDGTVLVTGGTRSGGANAPENFNNLDAGQPVHVAELWQPDTGSWTQLAAEAVDRCYHSTAVLLPDATVLSAGGGEYFLVEGTTENDPLDSHRDAQIFSPPYLFKGPRPIISSAPDAVSYGETFQVETAQASDIGKVTWIRLSSVTHSFNTGQRFNSLAFQPSTGGLDVTAPGSPNTCPPGHYMMFLLNRSGVPSAAKIMQVMEPVGAGVGGAIAARSQVLSVSPPPPGQAAPRDAFAQRAAILGSSTGTKVVVGLTGTCPYGIAACWGGAHEALGRLEAVQAVDPIPDKEACTATVFLIDDRLPPLNRWDEQFGGIVHESYVLRGAEISLKGPVERRDGKFYLVGGRQRPDVQLAPLSPAGKIHWDRAARTPQPASPTEAAAYMALAADVGSEMSRPVTVTGPISQTSSGYVLQVRSAQT
ncbi:MAG TPA: galactose oxidase-like domain-containing protein [Streptosporangiaceae bacterium]